MATVHFVKDGIRNNGDRVTTSVDIKIELAVKYLGEFSKQHTSTPPTLNPEIRTLDWDEFKHVVLEIPPGEATPPFEQPGYYYIIGLTPFNCQHLLGISAPSI